MDINKLSSRLSFALRGLKAGVLDLALKSGLINGHENFNPFIILGRPRVGSNLLLFPLRCHKQIILYGELYRFKHKLIRGYPLYRLSSKQLMDLRNYDPAGFADNFIFKKYPEQISAVGFKIFYGHAREQKLFKIWDYLHTKEDLKIIHIKRKNKLSSLVSTKIAYQNNKYVKLSKGSNNSHYKIKLTHEECLCAFNNFEQEESIFDSFFANHDKIEVFYEEISRNFKTEMLKIQNFLGVEQEQLKIFTKKQQTRQLSAVIENYDELINQFNNSKYFDYFEG